MKAHQTTQNLSNQLRKTADLHAQNHHHPRKSATPQPATSASKIRDVTIGHGHPISVTWAPANLPALRRGGRESRNGRRNHPLSEGPRITPIVCGIRDSLCNIQSGVYCPPIYPPGGFQPNPQSSIQFRSPFGAVPTLSPVPLLAALPLFGGALPQYQRVKRPNGFSFTPPIMKWRGICQIPKMGSRTSTSYYQDTHLKSDLVLWRASREHSKTQSLVTYAIQYP